MKHLPVVFTFYKAVDEKEQNDSYCNIASARNYNNYCHLDRKFVLHMY